MAYDRDALLDAFRSMTLAELAGFVKDFEAEFGVTAVPPVQDQVPAPPVVDEEPEEQAEYEVLLRAAGDKKIQVIKEVRALLKLGLKEAKDLVESAPVIVLDKTDRDTADRAMAALQSAGASVAIR